MKNKFTFSFNLRKANFGFFALALLLALFLQPTIVLKAQTLTPPSAGDGTKQNPYQIATLDNLYWLSQTSGAWVSDNNFIQTADIDATSTSSWDGGKGFKPIGKMNPDPRFEANYNGNGKSISKLFINRPLESGVGLFGLVTQGISNLTLINANITGYNFVGILVGYQQNGNVKRCSSSGIVSGTSTVGGLIGSAHENIEQSYSSANVLIGSNFGGGLCGAFDVGGSFYIKNCYATGSVTDGSNAQNLGGLIGRATGTSTIQNCYSTGAVSAASGIGLGGLIGSLTDATVNSCYWDTQTSTMAASAAGTGKTTVEMQTVATFIDWDFETIWAINGTNYPAFDFRLPTFDGGAGTVENPYLISSYNHLTQLSQFPELWGASFSQTTNIDASASASATTPYNPIGIDPAFTGTYNGHDYSIDGLTIPFSSNPGGLFANINTAIISNINLTNANISGFFAVGGIAGGAGASTISNCSVTGSISAILVAGGVVGLASNTNINKCSANVNVIGLDAFGPSNKTHFGGLVGLVNDVGTTISNSFARGTVSAYNFVGGLVGGVDMESSALGGGKIPSNLMGFTMTNCYAANVLTASGGTAGGVFGQSNYVNSNNAITITNSFWDTEVSVTSTSYVGGTGKITADMKTQSTFTGWDFTTLPVWHINATDNDGYPHLAWQMFASDAPTITSYTPTTAGTGTFISITGTNFTNASSVKFGGTEAVSFTVNNATNISAMVAAGTTGTISVTTPAGTATSSGTFTFKAAFLTNLANTNNGNAAGNADTYWNGQAFTTGNQARSLSSVDLSITLNGADAVVKIYSSSSGNIGTEIASLTGTYVSGSIYNFTPASPVTLLANTTYWLVLYSTILAVTTNSTNYDYTDDPTYTGTGTIPSTNRVALSDDAGLIWTYYSDPDPISTPYMFALYGDLVTSTSWTGAASINWNTAGNWSTNAVPTTSDNVTIPGTGSGVTNWPVVNEAPATPAVCSDLTINAGGILAIAPGKALTVSGTLTNNEGVTGLSIESDAIIGSGSLIHYTPDVPAFLSTAILGSANLSEFKYHLVSVPLTPSSNSTSWLFIDTYLFDFDVANNIWHSLGTSTTTDLDETKGYMVYSTVDDAIYSFDGNMNAGAFSPMVVHAGSGYNLVPNPYPSSIDWNAATGWVKANIDNATWIWNGSNLITPYGPGIVGNYAAYVNGSGTNGGSRYIAPGQAFFVKTNAASPVLTMTDAVRLHNATPFLKSGESIADLLRVKATANNYSDEVVVRFAGDATPDADAAFDAEKMYGLEQAPQLYTLTQNMEKLSINSLPFSTEATEVPMSFELAANTTCKLTFSEMASFEPETNIFLEDLLTGAKINLRQQNVYTFDHLTGNDPNRFKLWFGNVTAIPETTTQTAKMWINGNNLYINTTELKGQQAMVEVYNPAGQRLLSKSMVLNELTTLELNLKGFVIVKLTSGIQVLTTKGILMK